MLRGQKKTITIHQVLHGYDDGHRQLAASIELSSFAFRSMQVLSDMSGPTMLPGFEEYLTGYPLAGSGLYAFARTWYAPEMNRPGCVWTHTLLIPEDGLRHIRHLSVLISYFRRPQKGHGLAEYDEPVKLVVSDQIGPLASGIDLTYAGQLLAALYSSSSKSVLISRRMKGIDDLVMAVWSQQWPKLRMSFAFCTGALSVRRVDSRSLDLQIVPGVVVNQIKREKINALVVEANSDVWTQGRKPWLQAALLDLAGQKTPIFRDFLMQYGDYLEDSRSRFVPLVDTFLAYQQILNGDSVERLVEVLASGFPDADDAAELKAELLGGRFSVTLPSGEFQWSEKDLLFEIARTEHHLAFNTDSLRLRERGQALLEAEPNEGKALALALIDSSRVTPLGWSVLEGIAERMDASRDSAFLRAHRKLLLKCVGYNPALAASADLWRDTLDNQRLLLNAVADAIPSEETTRAIITVMLTAGAEIAEETVNLLGQIAVAGALDWFDSSGRMYLWEMPKAWAEALAARPRFLLAWLKTKKKTRPTTVALIASLLDPHSPEVHKFGTQFWLDMALDQALNLDREVQVHLLTFLLAFGFDNPGPGSDEIVARSFEIVHNAAEKDELKDESWSLVENQLPRFWLGRDKSERLRRGLVEKSVNFGWRPQEFLDSVEREDTFRRIVLYCSESPAGRKFLKKVRNQVRQGFVKATETHRSILDEYSHKYQRRTEAL